MYVLSRFVHTFRIENFYEILTYFLSEMYIFDKVDWKDLRALQERI